jgi:hypothetical protein
LFVLEDSKSLRILITNFDNVVEGLREISCWIVK